MKKKHEEHENMERWLVSYADFITLLFAFFVVMYSVSSVNEGKYRVFKRFPLQFFLKDESGWRPFHYETAGCKESADCGDRTSKITRQ